jgi:hypothetical protein
MINGKPRATAPPKIISQSAGKKTVQIDNGGSTLLYEYVKSKAAKYWTLINIIKQ